MDQSDVHASEETDGICLRGHARNQPDEIRAFMLLEYQRRDVCLWRLAIVFEDHAINNGKMDVRIVFRDGLHDWALRKADPNDEIVAAFRKGAHCRLDGDRIARLDVAH